MKAYKIFRGILKASALTTVMFIMQACYGSPNMKPMPEEEDGVAVTDSLTNSKTSVQADLQTAETENPDVESGMGAETAQ